MIYECMWQVSSGLKEDEEGSQGPKCHGGCQKFHFREFSVSCSQTSSCARKPLVLRHRCIVYASMWQVSSGLKEDEMGSQGPQCHGGCQKFHFREFSVSCSQTSFCARKPLVHSLGSGFPSHPLSILMRLATYLYILYIYVVVLAASWHKS